MGLFAAELLGLELPRGDKRLLVISETDGCAVDGLIAATGCRVGSRTLRILDFGKVAATFTDTYTEESIRIVPRLQARFTSAEHALGARSNWEAMLLGYQVMPVSELFITQRVKLDAPLSEIVNRPGNKAICTICGEEVMNGREVLNNGIVLCRACAGEGYYHSFAESMTAEIVERIKGN
ncbi:MAG: TraR/DksA C4-type zinc finger protein [Chloroflexi bacterium]|nr:TraR/DksA C4-type zinc finger protein [Chloroflexota bacterium]